MTNIPTVSFTPEIAPTFDVFWGKSDQLPNGDRRSCFHSHMGLWAMEPTSLQSKANAVISRMHPESSVATELKAELFAQDGSETSVPLSFNSAAMGEKYTAVVPVHGAITKKQSKFAETSALEVRRAIRQLAADDSIGKIVLHIDSPGGAVSGISDLADAVKSAASVKPVVAYIEDMGASAAYWIASQCTEIVANEGAFVGSLGTYGMIHDTSGAYERQGVKVHLISSGGIKGKGAEGTAIDKEVLADQQRIVDTINSLFKANVASGRSFSQKKIDNLFDGRVHGASEALRMGLIDRIGSFDSVLAEDKPMPEAMKKPDKEDMPKDEGEEEEEEEMPMKKKEDKKSHLDEDIFALAESIKEAGCPFSVESIKSKLSAAAEGHEDEIDAMEAAMKAGERLSKIKKFVGEHAEEETKVETVAKPKSYADMTSQYKAKLKEAVAEGISPEKLTSHMNEKHPELVEAMCAEATNRWRMRYSK
jgi:signal peptide peptidase SppA